MKKLSSVCLFAALATAVHAGPLSGTLMSGATNLIAANNTTWQIGTIAAATVPTTPITNWFNLNIGGSAATGFSYNETTSNAVITTSSTSNNGFIITGAQVNTNLLPVYAINTCAGFPGTIYGAANNVSVAAQVTLTGAASTTRTFQFNWYTSNDGLNANNEGNNQSITPAFTQFVTIPSGSTNGLSISNFPTAGTPYLLLGQMVNTNEVTGTNVNINVSDKAGL